VDVITLTIHFNQITRQLLAGRLKRFTQLLDHVTVKQLTAVLRGEDQMYNSLRHAVTFSQVVVQWRMILYPHLKLPS